MPKNKAPIARLGTPVIEDMTVTIDGYTSADPDGTLRRWRVTWGDDHYTEGSGHPGVCVHIYADADDYDIVLTVFDKKDVSTSTTVIITVPSGGPILPPPPGPVDCVLSAWSAYTPVSGPSGQWSPCFNNTQSRTEERTRTIVVAPANGGVPCDPNQRETRVVSQGCVSPPSTGVLSPSNFTFLGNVLLGAGGGNLAGKNENGQITLYTLSPHSDNGGTLYAMPYTPGQESIYEPFQTLPATGGVWPTWNDNTQLNVSYVYPSGAIRSIATTGGNPWPFLGLCYHGGLLYITFLDYYNSAYGATDHCMVICDLTQSGNARSKGSYRFDGGYSVKALGGGLCVTPYGLGMGGSMMCISRNTDNTWGPTLVTMPWAGVGSNLGGFNSPMLPTNEHLMHNYGAKATRNGDYIPDVDNPFNPDGPIPTPGYMTGTWTQRDRMNAIAWIETPSAKRGFLTLGGMATGYVWYGNWANGQNGTINPCHSADQGENAQGFRPEWRIYDPLQLNGGQVQPIHVFDVWDTLHDQANFGTCERYYTGCWYRPDLVTLLCRRRGLGASLGRAVDGPDRPLRRLGYRTGVYHLQCLRGAYGHTRRWRARRGLG